MYQRTLLAKRYAAAAETLIDAACAGDARGVLSMLRKGVDPNTRDENGYPVIALAALGGHLTSVAALVHAGADVNLPDGEGNTPLRWAAEQGRLEVAAFLLEMGAEPNKPNSFGYTPLYWAIENNRAAIMRLLLAHMDIRAGRPPRTYALDEQLAPALVVD